MKSPQYILCCTITIGMIALVSFYTLIDYAAERLEAANISVEAVPVNVASERGLEFATPAAPLVTNDVLDYIWWRESRKGQDESWRTTFPEIGQYQLTPIWLADALRLNIEVDPLDNESCRKAITIWLEYYAPRVGAETTEELYRLFRDGPTGYRNLKGI